MLNVSGGTFLACSVLADWLYKGFSSQTHWAEQKRPLLLDIISLTYSLAWFMVSEEGLKVPSRPRSVYSIWQPCMRLFPCGLNLTLCWPYKVALLSAGASALFLAPELPHSAPPPRTAAVPLFGVKSPLSHFYYYYNFKFPCKIWTLVRHCFISLKCLAFGV